jgi:hypothetical protein
VYRYHSSELKLMSGLWQTENNCSITIFTLWHLWGEGNKEPERILRNKFRGLSICHSWFFSYHRWADKWVSWAPNIPYLYTHRMYICFKVLNWILQFCMEMSFEFSLSDSVFSFKFYAFSNHHSSWFILWYHLFWKSPHSLFTLVSCSCMCHLE